MNKCGKIWGETAALFEKNNVEIHRIVIKPYSKCSLHKHEHKYNMFFIESGVLSVHVHKNDYLLVDTTQLVAGQSLIVFPGEFHQFETGSEECVAYEVYWTQISASDIVRKDCGSTRLTKSESVV